MPGLLFSELMHPTHAPQRALNREAYKRKLEMVQVLADLERRLKGQKKIADELSAYLLD